MKTNNSDVAAIEFFKWMWVLVFLLIVLFSGEPDIQDAIIYKLTNGAQNIRVQ